MKTGHQSVYWRIWRNGVGAAAVLLLLSTGPIAYAQSSVEKSETSQQAREPESELERAKAVVTKPNEPRPSPPETGRTWGVYSTTSSIEVGYRFVDTDGSRARYLSEVNVRDGLRLLDYSLDMRAQSGTGLLFDFLKADINNAGGDASQYFSLRADKTRAYRFDARVRRFNYFRIPGPDFAHGTREHDLRQQFSDFDLKLFPQRPVRVNLGYSRNVAKGRYTPTYSFSSDLFQLIGDQRWETNDFRAGIEASYRNWDFGFEASHRGFRNDPQIGARPGGDPGLNLGTPVPTGAISFLERDTPYRSRSIVTRASVRGNIGDRLHIVVRALHDDERSKVPYIETLSGTGTAANQNIISRVLTGEGFVERPGNVVEGGVTFEINKNFSIGDAFRYSSYRIEGDVNTLQNTLQRTGTGPLQTIIQTTFGSRLTDYESFWNTVELNMNFGRKFAANLGYRTQRRDVVLLGQYTSRTSTSPNVTNIPLDEEESDTTHAFVGGFRVRPSRRTSFFFDVEHGTNNNVFVRISPLEYTRFRARAQYQLRDNLTLIGAFTSTDRINPTPQVENESDFRSYTAAVSYEPNSRLMIDAGYDYHDLFSTAEIRYFISSQLREGDSLYYSRTNSVFVNTRFGVTSRLDLLLVYYYIFDRGAPPVTLGPEDFVSALPLRRHNPEARLAYRFNNRVTGNLSYRHYSYNERDFAVQDYRGNILTTSLRLTF
jgi:hypothetical protein